MTDIKDLITDNLDVWTSAIKKRNSQGRGSSKKVELTGIKKLRELILELAVSGKLVQQDLNDEPASVLLEKLAKEKAQLISDKLLKKTKALPAITDEEKPFELPTGWKWTRVGTVSTLSSGKGFKKSEYADTGARLFQIANVSLGYTKWEVENYLPLTYMSDYPELNLSVGDVLIALNRPLLNGSMKVCILENTDIPAILYQRVGKFDFYGGTIDTKYYYYFLQSPLFKGNLNENLQGSDQPFINQSQLVRFLFSLPPLAEQHRIVAKVDELMALCDQLEQQTQQSLSAHQTLVEVLLAAFKNCDSTEDFQTSWQRIAEHFDVLFTTELSIDKLKQTILQLAVMGKLVPQNPSDEPASVLLAKIAEEKAQLIANKKIKKQKPLPAITDKEKPFKLPHGWEWCNLGTLTTIRGGKRLPKGQQLTTDKTPYIYIRVSDMRNGSIREDDLHYISEDVQSKISNYIITKDDIYMTIVGATIGKCGLVPPKFSGMNLTENAARLTPFWGIDKTYLFKCLDSSFAQEQFFDKTKQVGVQKMALNRLSSTKIPFPPLAEQQRIVAKVNELMALCEKLKARLSNAQTTQLHLADAVVESALN